MDWTVDSLFIQLCIWPTEVTFGIQSQHFVLRLLFYTIICAKQYNWSVD